MKRFHLPTLPHLNMEDSRLFGNMLLIFAVLHIAYGGLLVVIQAIGVNFWLPIAAIAAVITYIMFKRWQPHVVRIILRVLSILLPTALTLLLCVDLIFKLQGFATAPFHNETISSLLSEFLAFLCRFVYPVLLAFTPALALSARDGGKFDIILLRVYAVAWLLLAISASFVVNDRLYKEVKLMTIPPIMFRGALTLIAGGTTLVTYTAFPPKLFATLHSKFQPKEKDKR